MLIEYGRYLRLNTALMSVLALERSQGFPSIPRFLFMFVYSVDIGTIVITYLLVCMRSVQGDEGQCQCSFWVAFSFNI